MSEIVSVPLEPIAFESADSFEAEFATYGMPPRGFYRDALSREDAECLQAVLVGRMIGYIAQPSDETHLFCIREAWMEGDRYKGKIMARATRIPGEGSNEPRG